MRKLQESSVLAAGLLLFLSVVWGGSKLIVDNDELSHAHLTYWIAQGLLPYRDFYASVYTPVFHWLLLPIFSVAGFHPETLLFARFGMMGLFIIRLLLLYALTKTLFTKRIGVLALLLHLLDPFTTITALQIRPDNLMIVLFLGAMVLLVQKRSTFGSGLLSGLSLLTMVKIAPSVFALGLFVRKRHWFLGVVDVPQSGTDFFGEIFRKVSGASSLPCSPPLTAPTSTTS